jgi:hypothetical protein
MAVAATLLMGVLLGLYILVFIVPAWLLIKDFFLERRIRSRTILSAIWMTFCVIYYLHNPVAYLIWGIACVPAAILLSDLLGEEIILHQALRQEEEAGLQIEEENGRILPGQRPLTRWYDPWINL